MPSPSERCDFGWELPGPSEEDRADGVTHRCRFRPGHEGYHRCACGARPEDNEHTTEAHFTRGPVGPDMDEGDPEMEAWMESLPPVDIDKLARDLKQAEVDSSKRVDGRADE
jgi:hypothetical protein